MKNIHSSDVFDEWGQSRDDWFNAQYMTMPHERNGWLSKERDKESTLSDHGVRKYDYTTRRFTSGDVLWEQYISFSPYQYSLNNPINLKDVNGKLPGDPFVSAAQAAHDFGKNYNPLSNAIDSEIATTIYQYTDAKGQTQFTYAVPNAFHSTGSNSGLSTIEQDGYVRVAEAHTHGPIGEGNPHDKIKPNNFSAGDKSKKDVNQFLVTPGGSLKEFNPKTKEQKTVTEDMPKDKGSKAGNWKDVDKNKKKDPRPLPIIGNTNGGMNQVNDATTQLERKK